MSEHQEKSSRLQKRLTQAEQKAANATQQVFTECVRKNDVVTPAVKYRIFSFSV